MICSRAPSLSSCFQLALAIRGRIHLRATKLHFWSDPSFRRSIGGCNCSNSRYERKLTSRTIMSNSINPSSIAEPILKEEIELLSFVNDTHGGVIVEMKNLMDPESFASSLRASISNWRKQGIRGVWIKMPINLANLIQPAVQQGFWYHHAEKDYLMLVYWIPETIHTLPVNASHRVGVGAFVINNNLEVLVVQEKSGVMKGKGIWKFPTGVVDAGEYIHEGAVREVKEETGVDTEFLEVLAFRQSHMSFFDKSDMFFICMLKPLSFEIQIQESEIEAATWMAIEEFAVQPFVKKHELLKYIVDISMAKIGTGYTGFCPATVSSAFTDKQSFIYVNKGDLNRSNSNSSSSLEKNNKL